MNAFKGVGLVVGLFLIAVSPARAAGAAQVIHNTFTLNVNFSTFSECTNEFVDLSGSMRVSDTLVVDSNGGVHFVSTFNNQGIAGVGEISGTQYEYVGASSSISTFVSASEFTTLNNFLLISHGSSANLMTTFQLHVTTNANGVTTAQISNIRFQCI